MPQVLILSDVSCSGGSLGLAGSQIPTTFFTRQGDESHSGIHREVIDRKSTRLNSSH